MRYDRPTAMRYDESSPMGIMSLLSWVWWAFFHEYDELSTLILSGSKPSTDNISMRHRRICFIFASLNSSHSALQFELFEYLLYDWDDVCARNIQLHKSNWSFDVFRVKSRVDIVNFSNFFIGRELSLFIHWLKS